MIISIFTLREEKQLEIELCNEQETSFWGGKRVLMPGQERSNK